MQAAARQGLRTHPGSHITRLAHRSFDFYTSITLALLSNRLLTCRLLSTVPLHLRLLFHLCAIRPNQVSRLGLSRRSMQYLTCSASPLTHITAGYLSVSDIRSNKFYCIPLTPDAALLSPVVSHTTLPNDESPQDFNPTRSVDPSHPRINRGVVTSNHATVEGISL